MVADLILGAVMDVTLSKVISVTTEQLNLAVEFKQELRRFRVVMKMVRGVLQDAEEKKVLAHSDLKPWLEELASMVDDADDLVDEIAYENLRRQVAQKQMWKKVCYFLTLSNPSATFRSKMAKRIKDLSVDIASLNDWATGLGLQYRLANKLPEHVEIQQTDSLLADPSKVVGRENELLEVVQLLIDSSNDQPLPVISIVGMGGIGKTTMAKLVCNKMQKQKHFDKIMWVCVSKNFDVEQILEEMMLQSLAENDSKNVTSHNIVVQKLQENLSEKNYFLILDDVWNEDRRKWESLKSCLLGIGRSVGSRVLVTTRSENVASIMGTLPSHMHHLKNLEDNDCQSIIKQKAFVNSPFPPELEEIAKDIASKCRGVALVAEVIGGTLWNNRNKDDWKSIENNSEGWDSMEEDNGALRVLQLSFDRLPTAVLKQCFALCSIFPKGFVMEKEMVIQLWMAEGFLQPFCERHLEMEDIGDKYFNALLSHSLFQDATRDSYGHIITCKMHDFIHDLARFVSKAQTLILEDGSGSNIPADVRHLNLISQRHLNLISGEGMTTTKLGATTKKLHTLFSDVDVLHNMPANLRKVRVLSFYGANIDKLPAYLGKLKHLKFLDVSDTGIKELPKFITKLYHLQTFRFIDCWRIKRPLEGIWDLVNLRHIYFNNKNLMPAGIGRLTCLKTLKLFVVGRQKGHRIEELRCLSQLRGRLKICNLGVVRDKDAAMEARLFEKATIQELQLVFGWESASQDTCKHDEDILEGLQPHSNLRSLTIKHYCGKRYPSWMSVRENLTSERVNFLKNLVSMTFDRCSWLETLPNWFGNLSTLQTLRILNCKSMEHMEDIQCLSKLKRLYIYHCPKLVEYTREGGSKRDSISRIPNINIDNKWIKGREAPVEDNEQLPASKYRSWFNSKHYYDEEFREGTAWLRHLVCFSN